jgi:hypothetical protein
MVVYKTLSSRAVKLHAEAVIISILRDFRADTTGKLQKCSTTSTTPTVLSGFPSF